MQRRRQMITLGVTAIVGHAVGMVADLASGYAPAVEIDLGSITSLSLDNIAPLLRAKPLDEVLIGHYLAIFFIPLGLFGIWQVYQGLKPQKNRFALPFLLAGTFGLIYASFYHGTLGFVAGALQAQEQALAASELAQEITRQGVLYFNSLSEPLGTLLLLVDLIVTLLFVFNVWFRETFFPRWMIAVNPLTIQGLITLAIWIAPHPLNQALWLTVFNLSLAIWYAATTFAYSRTLAEVSL